MSELFSLRDQTAIVTGAGQGNGAAIARGLAQAGARVAVVDLNEEAASQTASAICDQGASARSYGLDVSKADDCVTVCRSISQDLGPVSILVNNAGILRRGAFGAANFASDWCATFDVNVHGAAHMVLASLEDLKATRGSIVNLGSIQSFVATKNSAAYTASKGAVLQMTRALAVELAEFGIRVNGIAPGFFETPMTLETRAHPRRMESLLRHTPLGRVGQPEELIGAAVFLSSAAASYITGAMVPVDGGYLTL